MVAGKKISIMFAVSVSCTIFGMDNPHKNPTTSQEAILNTQHTINKLRKELNKAVIPKYDAVKVLREWTNDPEFSKKIQQEQIGKPVDTGGLVAHAVSGTEQAAKENNPVEKDTLHELPVVKGNLFTVGIDLQRGGTYVAIAMNDNVKADIQKRVALIHKQAANNQQRFGRGSSGKNEKQIAAKL